MAVVTKYSSARRDPSVGKTPKAYIARAELLNSAGIAAIANGDSANSVIYFGTVPSSARLSAISAIRCTAVTGAAMNLGFDVTGKGAVLAAAQSLATAGSFSATSVLTAADLNKRVWELCGYTADPGSEIDVIGTLTAGATAAGTVAVDLFWGA